ncbi:hypothetical protein G4G28_23020 [Massilia sp. Dwa41.01b]|uniref:hypothetical protein n=1 Tax=unclassified Massilia TaxID=2609279 RepID=UPI00160291D7|nr:hypothetical protein [Massilia sp. Dwa41.01b]QNA90662.1 hypothetical protein G4G28_23020 [Massilia sp. Dwa41.01b]QNA97894.1 hypothetical protein G4G31_02090 [Massilia sp. Se16.2.3]
MIRSHLRAGFALACALSLSACGGSDGEIYLSGKVSGVTKPGLVLTNNGGSDLPITAGSASYRFPPVETDSNYNIEVKSQPENVEKKTDCVVSNGIGRAVFNMSNIDVTCTIWRRALGGKIEGLGNRSGLVLVNGADRVAIPANATEFQMAAVSQDAPYGITVLPQAGAPQCTVENGSGIMPAAPVTTVVVRCTP